MNRTIFSKLVNLHIITPGGLGTLLWSFFKDGVSLMALLRFAAKHYPERCAIVDENKRLTYKEIYELAQRLAKLLYRDYGLKTGMCVGVLCHNHIAMALLLPALSRLGVRVKLLNTDIAPIRLKEQVERNDINLLIYDAELKEERIPAQLPCEMRECEDLYREIIGNAQTFDVKLPRIGRGGEISVFTGGSSGRSKEAPRQMSVGQFLPPFYALLEQLRLDERDSVFLSLPVYHGFGLATLIMSLVMGKKVCLQSHFDADKALKIISKERNKKIIISSTIFSKIVNKII